MKSILFFIFLSQIAFSQTNNITLEDKIYTAVDAFVANPNVETLKNIQESILSSIKYEIISQKDNIEEIKVNFNFNYYESISFSVIDIVEIEIFNNQIKNSYGKAEDMINLMNIKNKYDEEKLKIIVKLYNHIGDILKEAKENVLINQKKLEVNKQLN